MFSVNFRIFLLMAYSNAASWGRKVLKRDPWFETGEDPLEKLGTVTSAVSDVSVSLDLHCALIYGFTVFTGEVSFSFSSLISRPS